MSNFHHKRGGAWEVILLGTIEQMYNAREKRIVLDLILFGTILMMGLYHLELFMVRKKDASAIYFGLFCILIALRILTSVERYLTHLFPNMDWEVFVKIEYFSLSLTVPVFALFVYSLFSEDFHKTVLRIMVAIGLIASVVVIATPARIFTYSVPIYQTFMVACFLYGFYVLIRAKLRGREGAVVILSGYAVLFISVINDILDVNEIVQTGHFVQHGLFIFILSQALLLSLRFSKTYKTMEFQREALSKTNEQLRTEVVERQRAEQEKLELQEKLVHAQKMEAIGVLAGGVAHDLNNILAGIVTYPVLLIRDLSKDNPLKQSLETIKAAGLRAGAVVQDLLSLARRGIVTQFEVLNLNDLILDYLHSPEHRKLSLDFPGVIIKTQLEAGLFNIEGSPFHLKKAVMNLLSNAAEAQPGDGIITVSTLNRYLDSTLNGYENVHEGAYVVLRVEDKGPGIAPEDLKKIFEPFYTKKIMGRSGTGLGLAVVWGTMHDHHGRIDVRSQQGRGTSFELYFPITAEEIVKKPRTTPIDEYMGQHEKILVVDDVREQREIASRILKRLGYSVATVASGEKAVEWILKRANEDHIIIFKQGAEAWNNWRKENPEIRPNLSEASLVGVDFYAGFAGAELYRADLRAADLRGADLRKANFRRANLSEANLNEANLSEADVRGAKLSGADLSLTNLTWTNFRRARLNEANLSGADLRGADLRGAYLIAVYLSGAAIDYTRYAKIKGCQPGINGFWCKETDSAALMIHTPPGNSMQGSKPDAVIESLKRARNLHTYSMALSVLMFFYRCLQPAEHPWEIRTVRHANFIRHVKSG